MSKRKITFPYFPDLIIDIKTDKVGNIYRPYVPIQILGVGGNENQPFRALLDSGADRNLFPAAFGVKAGIDVRKGAGHSIKGIGAIEIKVYTVEVEVELLCPSPPRFKVLVDFSYEHKIPLLGRQGFFDQFKQVSFREKKKEIELKI